MAPRRFSYAPERVFDDLYCLPLPLHDGSPVNVFVAPAADGVYLIDGGLDTELAQATLLRGLHALGFGPGDVRGILITHGHTDHIGAAGAIAAAGGMVLAHALEHAAGRRLEFDEAWLERHGLPPGTNPLRWGTRATWPTPTRSVEDGETLAWGNLQLRVVWCPGHTPGLVCLYEPRRQVLFTTDHVMRRAPSPVSLRSPGPGDPLADYLASVDKLADLDVRTVLPGHGRPFGGLPERLAQIRAEIGQQLVQIRQHLGQAPASAYELLRAGVSSERRPVAERYAISQVLARLRYLERRGEASADETADGLIRFSLLGGRAGDGHVAPGHQQRPQVA